METGSRAVPAYVPGHQLLSGRTVLLTAAAGAGIGFAAAKKSLEEGASCVVISDIHEGRLAQAVEVLQAVAPEAQVAGVLANVTDESAVQQLVAEAERISGGIDVLINNAGLGGTCSLLDMTDEAWTQVMDVTLTGTMRMTRAMLGPMRERGRGVIVNNASVLGWRAQKEQSHYAAAKAGVMALTRCAALWKRPSLACGLTPWRRALRSMIFCAKRRPRTCWKNWHPVRRLVGQPKSGKWLM